MRPVFLATHPRSASTAFERSFMSRSDMVTVHEPFGEPFYFGPERLSDRYNASQCNSSEYKNVTFGEVLDQIEELEKKGQRIFVKDMAQYIIPADGPATLAPSVKGSHSNPSVLSDQALDSFDFVFLIRPPHLSVPSYYSCCIPPKSEKTGFDHYRRNEAGYRELRILFDYLSKTRKERPLIIDACDLGVDPGQVMNEVCRRAGVPFDQSMLTWEAENGEVAEKFAKWPGFHDDALKSTGFRKASTSSIGDGFKVDWLSWENDWRERFDVEHVRIIKQSVEAHLDDYLYLRNHKLNLK